VHGCQYGDSNEDVKYYWCKHPYAFGWLAAAYFVSFTIFSAMIALNLFVGIVVTKMSDASLQTEEDLDNDLAVGPESYQPLPEVPRSGIKFKSHFQFHPRARAATIAAVPSGELVLHDGEGYENTPRSRPRADRYTSPENEGCVVILQSGVTPTAQSPKDGEGYEMTPRSRPRSNTHNPQGGEGSEAPPWHGLQASVCTLQTDEGGEVAAGSKRPAIWGDPGPASELETIAHMSQLTAQLRAFLADHECNKVTDRNVRLEGPAVTMAEDSLATIEAQLRTLDTLMAMGMEPSRT